MAKSKTTVAQTSSKSKSQSEIPVAQVAAQPTLAERIATQEREVKNMEAQEQKNGAATEAAPYKKATAPANLTRAHFRKGAKPVVIRVDGVDKIADVKEFQTGSLGWHLADKISVMVDGVMVRVQMGVTLTIVGSKELPA